MKIDDDLLAVWVVALYGAGLALITLTLVWVLA